MLSLLFPCCLPPAPPLSITFSHHVQHFFILHSNKFLVHLSLTTFHHRLICYCFPCCLLPSPFPLFPLFKSLPSCTQLNFSNTLNNDYFLSPAYLYSSSPSVAFILVLFLSLLLLITESSTISLDFNNLFSLLSLVAVSFTDSCKLSFLRLSSFSSSSSSFSSFLNLNHAPVTRLSLLSSFRISFPGN